MTRSRTLDSIIKLALMHACYAKMIKMESDRRIWQ
jgi:hypothetical protein